MRLAGRILTILFLSLIIYANVWQRVQVLRSGYKVSEYESRKEELIKEHTALWLKVSQLKSVERIEDLYEVGVELTNPKELRVVELVSSGRTGIVLTKVGKGGELRRGSWSE